MRTTGWLLAVAMLIPLATACGGDEDAPPPPPPVAAPPPPNAPKPAAGGSALTPRMQIESRVVCPEIEKATQMDPKDKGHGVAGDECKLDVPTCQPGLYCLPVTAGGTFCEPCAERQTIRHTFTEHDFAAAEARDPFQSFVIVPVDLQQKTEVKQEGPCTRKEQFIAPNYSYLDLRLVGIVSQGTQRKVLMLDRGNLGYIIRRGDCVGKEKAVVKDIGDIGKGYVTFVVQPDESGRNPAGPVEHSVELHPKTIEVQPEAQLDSSTPAAPIVAPPGGVAPPTNVTPPSGTAPPTNRPIPPPPGAAPATTNVAPAAPQK